MAASGKRWLDSKDFAQPQRPLGRQHFETIRWAARTAWDEEGERAVTSATTYGGHHGLKILDEASSQRVRPSSPTRLNKPHPPELFLVTRLHYVPDYFRKSDASTDAKGESRRSSGAETAHLQKGSLRTSSELLKRLFVDARSAQAAAAWMKVAPENERSALKKMFESTSCVMKQEGPPEKNSYVGQVLSHFIKPEHMAAIRMWIGGAGRRDVEAVEKFVKALPSSHHLPLSSDPGAGTTKARDFQIHPEWVTQPWHTGYLRPRDAGPFRC
ncbi:uncharacterized protein LOC127527926 [Erpetoichthys calabaricus]|uniref:uncharacterized protein LOC127527926 n=1 Tax=Erpetoichthys calabaricus TaxID=27687 RepID=UPI002234E7CB|nr:uncharacterized protein LOC127527926 [Erpetoichthys calabaricus]